MPKSLVVEIVKKVSPAVVSVIISKDLPKIRKYFIQPFDEFIGPYGPPMLHYRKEGNERVKLGGGSGFLFSPRALF